MTWPDTVTYIGIATVVMGGLWGMVQHLKPAKNITELEEKFTDMEKQVKDMQTRNANIESKLETKRLRLDSLELKIQDAQASFTKSVDSLRGELTDLKENVREDMKTLNQKIDGNHNEVVRLLLNRE